MKNAVEGVVDSEHLESLAVETLLRFWQVRNLEGIKVKAEDIDEGNPRYQEAMYYLGLAYFHSNEWNRATEIWEKAIETNRQTAWAYRLDLARGLVKLDPTKYLSAQDRIPSLLGRVYLCPNGLKDLSRKLDD